MSRRDVRSVTNNWFLLTAVSAVSFGGAALYAVVDDPESPAYLLYFLVTSIVVAVSAVAWFRSYPPRLTAPSWAYAFIPVLLIVSATLTGMIPGTQAIGSWLSIGLVFALYGALERSWVIALTGGLTAAVATIVYSVKATHLGATLEIVTGAIFALGAGYLLLRGRRSRGAAAPVVD